VSWFWPISRAYVVVLWVVVLCQHDAMALGCQVAATSAGLAAACPSGDQRPGGARCGMRGSPYPRGRPCEPPAAVLRPGGDPTVTGVPTQPSRRPHGAARLHNPVLIGLVTPWAWLSTVAACEAPPSQTYAGRAG
jgi:hypothetical protein